MIENLEVFTQNSILVRNGEQKIYIDPFKMNATPKDADYILITHDHYDHFSPEDIRKVAGGATIMIVPEKMAKKAEEVSDAVREIRTVQPGDTLSCEGFTLEAVPAYNVLKPFHPKHDRWVGYLITVGGEKIYIAGDTDATDEAKSVCCDIALLPIGGTYTMDAKSAAKLANTIKPKIVVPVHYGGIVGEPGDGETFASLVDPSVKVEFKIAF
ncbi:MAG: MBL fold metallo-hydrolase [Lachnospiraceae bacterium]|nr:MBL fold metallo-hydrolase [Lachnospiraceae bacterium]